MAKHLGVDQGMVSNSRLVKVGAALAEGSATHTDEELLREFLQECARLEQVIKSEVSTLAQAFAPVEVSSRTKSRKTLVEKLRRISMALPRIDDVIGVRVVLIDGGLGTQDKFGEALTAHFGPATVTMKDRRNSPQRGYRALHIIGRRDGHRFEIQVRTYLQHLWAQAYEEVADRLNARFLRYEDGDPDDPRVELLDQMILWSRGIRRIEDYKQEASDLIDGGQVSPAVKKKFHEAIASATQQMAESLLEIYRETRAMP